MKAERKRGSIFRKLLLYTICACLLTGALTVVLYMFTGASVLAQRIADELVPRAYGIAGLASRYTTGQITYDSFINFTLREQRGTNVYVFDNMGNCIAYTSRKKIEDVSPELMPYAYEVLEQGAPVTVTDWQFNNRMGIVVGVPVMDNMQRVTGAILMSKSSDEVRQAMLQLVYTLVMSCLGVSALMMLPAYFISKRISDPIRRMTDVSTAMAAGDFSVRADENSNDEIGQLGLALNFLSARLDTNINDLKLARNRLHSILDGLQEGVAAFDAANELIYRNSAVMQLFGCVDEKELRERLAPAMPLCAGVAADKEPRAMQLTAGERKLLLTASYSQESIDTAPGAIIVVQDVTAAERLEQTRRDYVANVSHELRTPIASIRSLAETLDDGLIKNEEDRSRYYGYILRESMRLTRLINDLLELSRLQSGTVALEKRAFPLNGLLREVVERTQTTASYSGISVLLDTKCLDDVQAFSNRDRIEQVLIALTDNAIKFCSDDGEIVLGAAVNGTHADITVQNTGHIDEKDLPHLFERFYKADAAHAGSGTGLGLAIVEEVLALLGERIEAENRDGRAVFRFTVALSGDGGGSDA